MRKSCDNCKDLQPPYTTTTAPRPEYTQPTLYDHFDCYRNYKEDIIKEEMKQKRKEELTKLNENFTNWQPTSELETFSAENFPLLRQKPRTPKVDDEPPSAEPAGASINAEKPYGEDINQVRGCNYAYKKPPPKPTVDSDEEEERLRQSIVAISRNPVQCPITDCNRIIGVASLLAHYLQDHINSKNSNCKELFRGQRCVMYLKTDNLQFRKNTCLGLLAYGGLSQDDKRTYPANRGICMVNSFVPKLYETFGLHLPVLILACRTTLDALNHDKTQQPLVKDPNEFSTQLIVIWLVTAQTTKPVHCTVTVYDHEMNAARSAVVRCRYLNESQNPQEFLPKDTNCLRLTGGEIKLLSLNFTECIHLEVMIDEYHTKDKEFNTVSAFVPYKG